MGELTSTSSSNLIAPCNEDKNSQQSSSTPPPSLPPPPPPQPSTPPLPPLLPPEWTTTNAKLPQEKPSASSSTATFSDNNTTTNLVHNLKQNVTDNIIIPDIAGVDTDNDNKTIKDNSPPRRGGEKDDDDGGAGDNQWSLHSSTVTKKKITMTTAETIVADSVTATVAETVVDDNAMAQKTNEISDDSTENNHRATTADNNKSDDDSRLWRMRYDELVMYNEANGHVNVPRGDGDNSALADWIDMVRRGYKRQKEGVPSSSPLLSLGRIEALDRLGFQWDGAFGVEDEEAPDDAEPRIDVVNQDEVSMINVGNEDRNQNMIIDTNSNKDDNVDDDENDNGETKDNEEKESPASQPKSASGGKRKVQDLSSDIMGNKKHNTGKHDKVEMDDDETMMEGDDSPQDTAKKYNGETKDDNKDKESPASQPKSASGDKRKVQDLNSDITGNEKRSLGEHSTEEMANYGTMIEGDDSPEDTNDDPELATTVKSDMAEEDSSYGSRKNQKQNFRETKWLEKYEKLIEFKSNFGHCRVPDGFVDDPSLAFWVSKQRQHYRKWDAGEPAQISKERINLLNDINFEWKVGSGRFNKEGWLQRYDELKEFKEKFGHCNVPFRHNETPSLYRWVYSQRIQYKLFSEGKPSQLTEERLLAMQAINFDWGKFQGQKTKATEQWMKRYTELKQFYDENGHSRVPWRYFDNLSLSEWVKKQRQHWKRRFEGKPSPLTDDRIALLNEVDFTWEITKIVRLKDTWYDRYDELREYNAEYGHCRVPSDYDKNRSLAMWVKTQRKQYKLVAAGKPSSLTFDKIKLLEELSFQWKLRDNGDESWSKHFAQLEIFYARRNRAGRSSTIEVSQPSGNDDALIKWMSEQRKQYKRLLEGSPSTLTAERMNALQEVGFEWDAYRQTTNAWEKRYEDLICFKAREGHCKVPLKYDAMPGLGQWAKNQRSQIKYMREGKKTNMTEQKLQALRAIGFYGS